MEKYEFMSPAWIEMARVQILGALAGKSLSEVDYTLCEEFTDPPPHLKRPGQETIGFYLKVDGGRVEIGDHPVEDADLKVVSDYQEALVVARDPEAPAADPNVVQERMAAGRMKVIGNPATAPTVLRELDVHRLLSPRTA